MTSIICVQEQRRVIGLTSPVVVESPAVVVKGSGVDVVESMPVWAHLPRPTKRVRRQHRPRGDTQSGDGLDHRLGVGTGRITTKRSRVSADLGEMSHDALNTQSGGLSRLTFTRRGHVLMPD
jgi:hypothetical protein